MGTYNIEILKNKIGQLGISLNEDQASRFLKYYELLIEWNSKMNLTGIVDYEEVVVKHFVDSLSLVNAVCLEKTESLIDIGTGAGFPGIPLKIAFPHLRVVLLDSLNKRIKFLDQVILELGLKEIKTIHGRAEDYSRNKEYRDQFDLCVSRAVANLSTLSEYCLPYVKPGGKFVSYKTNNIEEEIESSKNAIFLLGGKAEEQKIFDLPDTDISRNLVVIKKIKNTPGKYPRKTGVPAKEPIH